MGGLCTNDKLNVITKDGKLIPGLYAAGELVGGVMGADSPAGANVGWALASGRVAADAIKVAFALYGASNLSNHFASPSGPPRNGGYRLPGTQLSTRLRAPIFVSATRAALRAQCACALLPRFEHLLPSKTHYAYIQCKVEKFGWRNGFVF